MWLRPTASWSPSTPTSRIVSGANGSSRPTSITLPSCSSRTTSGRPTANGSPSGTVAPGGSVWRSPASSMWTLRASETRIRTCSARSTSGRSPRIRVTASARSVSAASSALRRSISRRRSRSRAIARWRSPRIQFWRTKASAPATDQAAPQTQIASVDAPPTTSSTASDAGKIVRDATGASSLRDRRVGVVEVGAGAVVRQEPHGIEHRDQGEPDGDEPQRPPRRHARRQDPVAERQADDRGTRSAPRDSRAPSPSTPPPAASRPAVASGSGGAVQRREDRRSPRRPSRSPGRAARRRRPARRAPRPARCAAPRARRPPASTDARSTRIVAGDGVTRRPSAPRSGGPPAPRPDLRDPSGPLADGAIRRSSRCRRPRRPPGRRPSGPGAAPSTGSARRTSSPFTLHATGSVR